MNFKDYIVIKLIYDKKRRYGEVSSVGWMEILEDYRKNGEDYKRRYEGMCRIPRKSNFNYAEWICMVNFMIGRNLCSII